MIGWKSEIGSITHQIENKKEYSFGGQDNEACVLELLYWRSRKGSKRGMGSKVQKCVSLMDREIHAA